MKATASQSKPRSGRTPPPPGLTSVPAKARTRAAHLGPERRRPQILDVAFELFLEHGYRGTSMQAVAEAAGVSKPVVYACFASKGDLFAALLDREEQRMLDHFRTALAAGVRAGDLRSILATGFTAMLQAVLDMPAAYRVVLLGGGHADAVVDTRVRRAREGQIAAIAALSRQRLEARMSARRAEPAAEFVGHTLVALGEAGIRMLLADPDRWTPEALGPLLGGFAAGGYEALLGDPGRD